MERRGIEKIIKEAMSVGRKTLAEPEAKEILRLSTINVPESRIVKDVTGAIEAAQELGYPVVLKIISPDIPHKSDVGGVALNIRSAAEVEEHWSQMIYSIAENNPVAMIEGFIVEKMAEKGVEVIIGLIRDKQFGPVVMFGTGGVAVELMKDVSFRLAPVTRQEAFEMMGEVKGYPLLTGFRGTHIKDLGAVAETIVKLSVLFDKMEDIKEFEINPLIVYEQGAIAVDARAILE
ncbi:MAG: acetate--CoA ligase family protein [Deltaproteobacteria bacterium]|nr:acetate--CoA ligase family protein [Deltaproteobacteria bacterium]